MEKYPLTTLDPETFIMTLEDIGGLNPNAEFKVDKKSKTLFALANDDDHKKIKSLIEDFDGSGREFEVIWLRRLPAAGQGRIAAGLALIMGGALGNVVDRVRLGYVVDFIKVHYGEWVFPAFNVADSAITIGAGLLILDSIIEYGRKNDRQT